jgi:glycosyltransferase involved in cell wall biosynthesis/peptidoglycan/xylan/chitin deacetylase (PgdA/CDA1 family)
MILENSSFPEDTRVWMESTSLIADGYSVSLVCPTGKSRRYYEIVDGVHVYRYPAVWELSGFWGYIYEYGYSLICAFVLSLWIRLRHGFDAIHIHCPPDLNCMLAIFHKMLGCKFVFDLHDLSPELYQAQQNNQGSPLVKKALLYFESLACRHADVLIATNQTQQMVQCERGGAAPQRCYIVRNGPNELFTRDDIEPLPELQIPGKTIIGYVGTMGRQDGVDYLIRALELLSRQRQDFHAYLVGRGSALSGLKQLVLDLRLETLVTFTGFVPFQRIPRYIASFDICATPDPSNPYNDSCTTIKTMEYMALGRPTVAFRTPENQLSAGESAVYADDVPHFATLLSQLMDDPVQREAMGLLAKRRVRERLAWKYQSRALLEAYSDLFNGRVRKVTRIISTSESFDTGRIEPERQSLGPCLADYQLPVRFCYGGSLGNFLQEQLERDLTNARLSRAFRNFYNLRPMIPGPVRRWAQSQRNRKLTMSQDWYIPPGLAEEIRKLESPLPSIWPNAAEFALVVTHDVEEQRGFDHMLAIASMEERLGLRSCWNIVPFKYTVDFGLLRELQQRGHEVAIHGYNHDGRLFSGKGIFDSRIAAINQVATDWGAKGFRAPMVHRNLSWMQALMVDYDCSCFDVDPFQAMPGGVSGIWPFQVGKLVELPYTLPQDHTLFVTLKENSTRIWQDKLKFIRQHHGMALMLTHPDYLLSGNLLQLYEEFLVHALSQGPTWHVLPKDMANWFQKLHPDSQPRSKSLSIAS